MGGRVVDRDPRAQGFPMLGQLAAASLLRTSGGGMLSWGSVAVTAPGGLYRMCWCAEGFACSQVQNFEAARPPSAAQDAQTYSAHPRMPGTLTWWPFSALFGCRGV